MTTASDIVISSLIELGVLASGEEPTDDEMRDCLLRLNEMLADWSGKMAVPWLRTALDVAFAAGEYSKVIDAAEIGLVYRKGAAPFAMSLTTPDDMALIHRTAGQPCSYSAEERSNGLVLTIWPTPLEACTVTANVVLNHSDLTIQSVTPIPAKWMETVRVCLASKLAALFPEASGAAAAISRAGPLELNLFDRSRPDVYKFEPDFSGYA